MVNDVIEDPWREGGAIVVLPGVFRRRSDVGTDSLLSSLLSSVSTSFSRRSLYLVHCNCLIAHTSRSGGKSDHSRLSNWPTITTRSAHSLPLTSSHYAVYLRRRRRILPWAKLLRISTLICRQTEVAGDSSRWKVCPDGRRDGSWVA
jgi:hypothetical protein